MIEEKKKNWNSNPSPYVQNRRMYLFEYGTRKQYV